MSPVAGTACGFNAENQITQMDGGAAVYAYDGEGRRMKKTVGAETTYFFYGPGGLISEFSTSAGPTQAAATDKPLFKTSDKLGTAVLIIAASGTVIENNRTLPYGELWTSQVSSANNEKFTTYERDQESALDYAMARYYSNTSGRFASPDQGEPTLFRPSTFNRYVYTSADPINRMDPTGNDDEGTKPPVPPPGCNAEFSSCGPPPTLQTGPEICSRPMTDQERQAVVDHARSFIGNSYYSQQNRFGKIVNGLYGFDCSGLVSYCLGLTSPQTVVQMASNPNTVKFDASQLKNGDLVIWQNPGKPAHIGIYDAKSRTVISATGSGVTSLTTTQLANGRRGTNNGLGAPTGMVSAAAFYECQKEPELEH